MHYKVLCEVLTYPRVACLGGIVDNFGLMELDGSEANKLLGIRVRRGATLEGRIAITLVQRL